MENLFIQAVKLINPLQTIVIGLIVFYFYNRLDGKIRDVKTEVKDVEQRVGKRIDNLEAKLDKFQDETRSEIKSINARIDKLYDLILDLYKTLSKRDAA